VGWASHACCRWLTMGPSPDDVMMLRDVNGDGKADEKN
jgi:hypothetical protein